MGNETSVERGGGGGGSGNEHVASSGPNKRSRILVEEEEEERTEGGRVFMTMDADAGMEPPLSKKSPTLKPDTSREKVPLFLEEQDLTVPIPTSAATLDPLLEALEFKKQLVDLMASLSLIRNVGYDLDRDIKCERISGALTNAIYVVSVAAREEGVCDFRYLLRVYGVHAGHLVDRKQELAMLHRLALHGIGPRLVGKFANGRFERWLDSIALSRDEMRSDRIMEYIARRMRELHDGIDLQSQERYGGPLAWKNIRIWLPRAREIVRTRQRSASFRLVQKQFVVEKNKKANLIIASKWNIFEAILGKYREWMHMQYPIEEVRKDLVFCHNDAQYGNLLRLQHTNRPLLPGKAHRELVVIDFEYAGPNPRAFDLANHFCEWMADYHRNPTYFIDTHNYPSYEQRQRFLKAYVEHGYLIQASKIPSSQIQATNNSGSAYSFAALLEESIPLQKKDSKEFDRLVRRDITTLEEDIDNWRAASHALWCIWGIIMDDENDDAADDALFFDYFGYADQRMRLFFGEMKRLGMLEYGKDDQSQGDVSDDDCKIIVSG